MTKSRKHFNKGDALEEKEATGLFTHQVLKVKKTIPEELKGSPENELPEKYKSRWYLKEVTDEFGKSLNQKIRAAEREVVAQELFRLLIPGQPKTRMVLERDENDAITTVYVASKEIPGYQKIKEKALIDKINENTCFGLGEVMVAALFLEEVDLKFGNMAFDEKNQVIKIDGDWCFSHLRKPERGTGGPISAEDISELPMLSQYHPYNWLSVCRQGIIDEDVIFSDWAFQLIGNREFTNEIYRACMKILLLPQDLIQRFVDSYIEDSAYKETIFREIVSRQEQIQQAVTNNASFKNYLKESGKQDCDEYIAYLSDFKTSSKNKIMSSSEAEQSELNARFKELSGSLTSHSHLTPPSVSEYDMEMLFDDFSSTQQITTALKPINESNEEKTEVDVETSSPINVEKIASDIEQIKQKTVEEMETTNEESVEISANRKSS